MVIESVVVPWCSSECDNPDKAADAAWIAFLVDLDRSERRHLPPKPAGPYLRYRVLDGADIYDESGRPVEALRKQDVKYIRFDYPI